MWRYGDLNPRHFACEANTLPLSYTPTGYESLHGTVDVCCSRFCIIFFVFFRPLLFVVVVVVAALFLF